MLTASTAQSELYVTSQLPEILRAQIAKANTGMVSVVRLECAPLNDCFGLQIWDLGHVELNGEGENLTFW